MKTALLFLVLFVPALATGPAVRMRELDGKPVKTDSLKGKVVVLDFWAVWCLPCAEEIPWYNRLQSEFRDRGVEVIGVALASGSADEVRAFARERGMKYRVVMGDDDQAFDLGITAFPTTYLMTRDWQIYRTYVGAGPEKSGQVEADIRKLLSAGSSN